MELLGTEQKHWGDHGASQQCWKDKPELSWGGVHPGRKGRKFRLCSGEAFPSEARCPVLGAELTDRGRALSQHSGTTGVLRDLQNASCE